MDESVVKIMSDYLAAHNELTLATVTENGTPLAHTVTYVSDGATVYFMTDENSRKIKNISKNPCVAYAVDVSVNSIAEVQGIQMEGRAQVLTDKTEIEKIFGLMLKKYPWMANLPPMPMVCVKVAPTSGCFMDNTQEIGHRDTLTF